MTSPAETDIAMQGEFEKAWRRRFERAAEKYCTDHAVSGWSEEGLRRRLVTFAECFAGAAPPAGCTVLDLGCGAGTYSAWLAALGYRVVALDYSTGTLRVARRRLGRTGVNLVAGDAYHLPVASAAFGAVVCIGVFQTLRRPRRSLAEIRRVLVPGGRLFLMTLNARETLHRLRRLVRRRPPGYKDLRRYDPQTVRGWLTRAGLRPEVVRPVYLLPGRAVQVSRVLERWGVYRAAAHLGTAPMCLGHAVLFLAQAE